jgi:hypothetical protein
MGNGGYIIYIPKIEKEIRVAIFDDVMYELKQLQREFPGSRVMIFEMDVVAGMKSVEEHIQHYETYGWKRYVRLGNS